MLSLAQWIQTVQPGDRLRLVSNGAYWTVSETVADPASITVRQKIRPGCPDGRPMLCTEDNGWLQILRHLQNTEPPFSEKPSKPLEPPCPEFIASLSKPRSVAPYTRQRQTPATITPETRRPRAAGVYRAFDVHSVLLYAGYSTNPVQRLKQHAAAAPWWALTSRTTVEWFDSTEEAARAERDAILTELPLYNARGATHPYISPVRNPA